jgi:hypothetical protein
MLDLEDAQPLSSSFLQSLTQFLETCQPATHPSHSAGQGHPSRHQAPGMVQANRPGAVKVGTDRAATSPSGPRQEADAPTYWVDGPACAWPRQWA